MHELLAPLLSDALVLSVAHKHAEAGGCLTYVPIKQLAKAILSAECRLSLVKKYTAQLRLWPTSFLSFLQHTDLIKSAEDPNTYLVNSGGDPMQQSLSGLLLDGLPPSASAAFLAKTGPHSTLFVSSCAKSKTCPIALRQSIHTSSAVLLRSICAPSAAAAAATWCPSEKLKALQET